MSMNGAITGFGVPMGDEMNVGLADLAQPPQNLLPSPQAVTAAIQDQQNKIPRSDLDSWAQRTYKLNADELLEPEQLKKLAEHVLDIAKKDNEYYKGRNTRFDRDQDRFELILPEDSDHSATGSEPPEHETLEETAAGDSEILVLPDTYLFVHKVDNMLSGAGYHIDVPARIATMSSSQKVENLCHWFMEEASNRHAEALNADLMLDVQHYLDLRGWVTALLMTNASDPYFPWKFELEDPRFVYPRYSRAGLIRVTRQYSLDALEARYEFPELEDALANENDETTIEIVGWFDNKYHCIFAKGVPNTGKAQDGIREVIKRPTPHMMKDIAGRPINPWIIQIANSRAGTGIRNGRSDTTNIGTGLLFGLEDTYLAACKLISMLLSNTARSADPPTMTYIDPANPRTEPLKLAPGSRNYAWFNREKVEVLDLAPNPGNLNPTLQMINDRLNKLTLPSVYWGDAGSVTSGYGVGLLSNAAKDLLNPYIQGSQRFLKQLFRRMLECYKQQADSVIVGNLKITQMSQLMGRRRELEFNPALIDETGVNVNVTFGEITPQDKAALAGQLSQLVLSGLYSKYRARKELGIEDPPSEEQWRAIEALLASDAEAALEFAQKSLEESDEDLIKWAIAWSQKLKMQQAALAAAGVEGNGGAVRTDGGGANPGPMATSVVPLERQIGPGGRAGMQPARENPGDQAKRVIDDTVARMSGGSLPAE